MINYATRAFPFATENKLHQSTPTVKRLNTNAITVILYIPV